jgi:hypothetical protein
LPQMWGWGGMLDEISGKIALLIPLLGAGGRTWDLSLAPEVRGGGDH